MKKILIINQYSSNKGDRAVLYALINLLRKYEGVEITVSTSTISDWDNTFNDNIKFTPWGWDYHPRTNNPLVKLKFFLLRRILKLTYAIIRRALVNDSIPFYISQLINPDFYNSLKDADLVISTGGHHVTTILAENAVSSQIFDLACSLILKKKVVLWSQTIGPLEFNNNSDKLFVEKIIKGVEAIYIRDEKSLEVLSVAGCDPQKIHRTFETVLSLNNNIEQYISYDNRKKIIGISIYSTVKRNNVELNQYISAISGFANYCINETDNEIVFLPMELKGSGPDDRWLIEKILENIKFKNRCSMLDNDLNTDEHFNFIKNCSYFLGHKTHSVIFALAAGVPLIAIAYHPKTIEFMRQYDNEEFALEDGGLTKEKLIQTFEILKKSAEKNSVKLFEQSRTFAQKIELEFDNMINKYL